MLYEIVPQENRPYRNITLRPGGGDHDDEEALSLTHERAALACGDVVKTFGIFFDQAGKTFVYAVKTIIKYLEASEETRRGTPSHQRSTRDATFPNCNNRFNDNNSSSYRKDLLTACGFGPGGSWAPLALVQVALGRLWLRPRGSWAALASQAF